MQNEVVKDKAVKFSSRGNKGKEKVTALRFRVGDHVLANIEGDWRPSLVLAVAPKRPGSLYLVVVNDEKPGERGSDYMIPQDTPKYIRGPRFRFAVGQHVQCRISQHSYSPGVVTKLNYREKRWPSEKPSAPYQVRLDSGKLIFCPEDRDEYIQGGAGATVPCGSEEEFLNSPTPEFARLCGAVMEGEAAEVKRLLQSAPLVRLINSSFVHQSISGRTGLLRARNLTLLISAITYGHALLVELLLDSGADVERAADGDERSCSPLCVCAQCWNPSSVEIAKLLLGRGAMLEKPNANGEVPLFIAASIGHTRMVELFLSRGAAADYKVPGSCCTPLFMAAQLGRAEVFELLVSNGCDVNFGSVEGGVPAPLFVAAQNGHTELVRMCLAEGADVDGGEFLSTTGGCTPLYAACCRGHKAIVSLLLDAGASQTLAADGATPLMVACQNGFHKIAKLLQRRGADVNAPSDMVAKSDGGIKTAIDLSEWHGNHKMAADLRDRAARMACAFCGQPASKRCGSCKDDGPRYCGASCQRNHWSVHKKHCVGRKKKKGGAKPSKKEEN